jgi:hypothetical protein
MSLCAVVVESERAMPSSKIAMLGPVPTSKPPLLFRYCTAESLMKNRA